MKNNPDGTPFTSSGHPCFSARIRSEEAEALIRQLRKRLPHSSDAALAIGDFYSAHNKPDEALSEYRRALSDSRDNLKIKKRMLDLYLLTDQTQLAVNLDQELVKNAPKDVLVRVNHGRVLMAQGNSVEAISQLQKVVTDAADSPQAHYFLGRPYWQSGKMTQASAELQEALKDFNKRTDAAPCSEAHSASCA